MGYILFTPTSALKISFPLSACSTQVKPSVVLGFKSLVWFDRLVGALSIVSQPLHSAVAQLDT